MISLVNSVNYPEVCIDSFDKFDGTPKFSFNNYIM